MSHSWTERLAHPPIQIQLQALASAMVVDIVILRFAVEGLSWSPHKASPPLHWKATTNEGKEPSDGRVGEREDGFISIAVPSIFIRTVKPMGSDLGAVLNQDAGVIHATPIPLCHSLHTLSPAC